MMDFSGAYDRLLESHPSLEPVLVASCRPAYHAIAICINDPLVVLLYESVSREEHHIIRTGKWASRTAHAIKGALSFSMRCQSLLLLHSSIHRQSAFAA